MIGRVALAVALLPIAGAASAQAAGECGEWTSARNIPEPWADNTATYADGAIRVTRLDTLEPAAAAVHLMILSPPLDELGDRSCTVVSQTAATDGWPGGFSAIDFASRTASYSPETGLVLSLPVEVFDPATGGGQRRVLRVTVDQTRGVSATMPAP